MQLSQIQTAIVIVIFIWLLARRIRGRRVSSSRKVIVFLLIFFYGIEGVGQAMRSTHTGHLTDGDIVLLTILAVVSFGIGLLRGTTVKLYHHKGELYARYRPVTVLLWIATFAVRFYLTANAAHFGASRPIADASLLVMFAISIAGEAVVTHYRSLSYDQRPNIQRTT